MMSITKYKFKDMTLLKSLFDGILVFLFFMVILLAFIGQQTWFVDENDNFLGAMTIVNGGDIYKDFCSQHMPLMYYLCAIFYRLGARTVVWYRLYFDIFTAVLWTAMYFRYKKHFGKLTMLMGPAIYAAALASNPDTATNFTYTAVLSDKLQAYGMVILLLEFIIFAKDKDRKLNLASCCWISFAIFISFGSTFVAIIGIFITGLSVLCIEIRDAVIAKRKIGFELSLLLKKYIRLFAIVILPFLILISWYAATGNLKNFYYGAFLLNMKYYTKYNGGYGTSIKLVMLNSLTDYFCQVKYAIQAMSKDLFYGIWMLVFFIAGMVLPACYFIRDKLFAVSLILIVAESTPRGYFNFHATAYFALSAFITAMLFQYLYRYAKRNSDVISGNTVAGVTAILTVIFFIPYISQFSNILNTKAVLQNNTISDSANDLRKITDPNEKIAALNTVVSAASLVEANRCMLNGASSTPWTNDLWGNKELQLIKSQKPRVVLCSADYDVWGHKFIDYAKPTYEYVKANYTQVGNDPAYSNIWIRNDYIGQARKRLGIIKTVQQIGNPDAVCKSSLDNVYKASQIFVSNVEHCDGVSMMIGTYGNKIHAELTLSVTDMTLNKQIVSTVSRIDSPKDNAYYQVPLSMDLLEGHKYRIDILPHGMTVNNKAVLYIDSRDEVTENHFAELDGKKENYNFCIQLFNY